MEGDGCNCSAVVISPIFEGLSLLQRQRAVLTVVTSPIFEGLSLLQRQRIVLAVVSEEIKSGELHALSVKTYTPNER